MAQDSIPWTTNGTGDGQAYAASEWSNLWRSFFGRTDPDAGPISNSGDGTHETLYVEETAPVSAAVYVRPGRALVHGTFYESTATETVAIAPNASGNDRIDIVVLEKDWTAQTIRLAVEQGTPAGAPVPPTLTQTSGVLWQIPLAHVAVANEFVTLSNANISDARHFVLAPGTFVGQIEDDPATTAPEGFVLAYGQTVSRTVRYDRLFARIGTTYGVGDGATTFELPDLRGYVVAGRDDMGGVAAGNLTVGSAAGLDGTVLGQTGGVEEHQLTVAELAAHTHDIATGSAAGAGSYPARGNNTFSANLTDKALSTGGDTAHTNVQPTIILNKIIRL